MLHCIPSIYLGLKNKKKEYGTIMGNFYLIYLFIHYFLRFL